MRRLFTWCAAALLLPAAGALAQSPAINGMVAAPRVFNDRPGSTLSITHDNNAYGGMVSISESAFGPGGFTNRHDVLLSADGGDPATGTAATFNIDASWTLSATVNLSAGAFPPHKEAGLRVNSPVTGDGLFIIKTNGEIVAFGGGAPFYIAPDTYVPGTSIDMTLKITSGGDGVGGSPNFVEYIYDIGAGPISSGPLVWSNLEFGPLNYNLGMYAQGPPADEVNDFMLATFKDVTFTPIPEPTSMALGALGLVCIATLRRRIR